MSGLAERNAIGRRAEHRTEAFLLDHFWVLKLSLDLDGAVFLAHAPTRTLESLRQPTTVRPVAVIQSKSWEDGAEVEVARLFVESIRHDERSDARRASSSAGRHLCSRSPVESGIDPGVRRLSSFWVRTDIW